eukprot:2754951-Amphidinium_carterae.1
MSGSLLHIDGSIKANLYVWVLVMEAHLMHNNFKKAWQLIEVMKKELSAGTLSLSTSDVTYLHRHGMNLQEGLAPNRVTFNELIN